MKEIKIIKEKITGEYIFNSALESYLTKIIRIKMNDVVNHGKIASITPRDLTIKTIPIETKSVNITYDANQVRVWFTMYDNTEISIYDPDTNSITDLTMSDLIKNNFKRVYEFDTSVIKPGMNILVTKKEYMSTFHVLDVGKDLIKFTTYDKNILDKTLYIKKLSKGGYYIEATPEQLANENYSYHYEENCTDRYFETGVTFDYKEMFHKLAQGFKVRCVDWNEGFYIYTKTTDIDVGLFATIIVDEKGEETLLSALKLWKNNDWEIYKEATENALR